MSGSPTVRPQAVKIVHSERAITGLIRDKAFLAKLAKQLGHFLGPRPDHPGQLTVRFRHLAALGCEPGECVRQAGSRIVEGKVLDSGAGVDKPSAEEPYNREGKPGLGEAERFNRPDRDPVERRAVARGLDETGPGGHLIEQDQAVDIACGQPLDRDLTPPRRQAVHPGSPPDDGPAVARFICSRDQLPLLVRAARSATFQVRQVAAIQAREERNRAKLFDTL